MDHFLRSSLLSARNLILNLRTGTLDDKGPVSGRPSGLGVQTVNRESPARAVNEYSQPVRAEVARAR